MGSGGGAVNPTVAPLVVVRNLKKHFPVQKGVLRRSVGGLKAVDGLDFEIRRRETLGLVGESGCGKSTTARLILKLEMPTDGTVHFDGQDLSTLQGETLRQMRQRMQMIFQDPQDSLNPRLTAASIIAEPLEEHRVIRGRDRMDRVEALMESVGLDPRFANRYPHEFSGGQKQRIGIARALALNPEFIVCDEPIAALDVSIQAQVVNLLQDLQQAMGLTYLFISHDLSMIRHLADRVAVMYLGRIVELAPRRELYANPKHPYTRALISAVPVPDPEIEGRRQPMVLKGEVPSPANPPGGCPFSSRCPMVEERCRVEVPAWRELVPGHRVACHLAN